MLLGTTEPVSITKSSPHLPESPDGIVLGLYRQAVWSNRQTLHWPTIPQLSVMIKLPLLKTNKKPSKLLKNMGNVIPHISSSDAFKTTKQTTLSWLASIHDSLPEERTSV